MAYSLIASETKGGAAGVTTDGVDSSGANLMVVCIADYYLAPGNVTDSKGNTLSLVSQHDSNDALTSSRIYICYNPTVGAAHTVSDDGIYASATVYYFNGSTSSPFDAETGGAHNFSVSTIQPGSITPAEDNELFVTTLGKFDGSSIAIDSGFSTPLGVSFSSGVHFGVYGSYKIQTTGGAENPTWTNGANAANSVAMATFKAAVVAPPSGDKTKFFFAMAA